MRGKGLGNCSRQLIKEGTTVRSMDVVLPVKDPKARRHAACGCGLSLDPIVRWLNCFGSLGQELPSVPKLVQTVVEQNGH
jgi:hypothetical protein